MARIEILRAGTWSAMDGSRVPLAVEDISNVAASYDPALHEAPVVIGHPATDDPAYGWVKSLQVDDGRLVAELDDVEPSFAELVKAGRYRKVSASLYRPDSAANPTPGKWHLRHVGFLGAQPPAVKGLRPVQLAAGDDGVVELADGWALADLARTLGALFQGLREGLIAEKGIEAADRALPSFYVNDFTRIAERAEREVAPPAPTGGMVSMSEEELRSREAELARREAELAAGQTRLEAGQAAVDARQAELRRAETAAFVEGLVGEGRVLPAEAASLVSLLEGIAGGGAVDLGEGKAQAPAEVLRGFLGGLPKRVDFSERGGGSGAVDASDPQAVAAEAQRYQAEQARSGVTVPIDQAVRHVIGSMA